MNKGISGLFLQQLIRYSETTKLFASTYFLFSLKRTSVNNTNRIINAGIFSVYASSQMNCLWTGRSLFHPTRKNVFVSFYHRYNPDSCVSTSSSQGFPSDRAFALSCKNDSAKALSRAIFYSKLSEKLNFMRIIHSRLQSMQISLVRDLSFEIVYGRKHPKRFFRIRQS